MDNSMNFMEIRHQCPTVYDRFKEFLMKYEFGNFCYTILHTYERYGAGVLKIDYQVATFFGWLDKFFDENGIFVNLQLVQNSKVDKDQVEHEAKATHYVTVTDSVRNSAWDSNNDTNRTEAFIDGFTEAFLMLEERL